MAARCSSWLVVLLALLGAGLLRAEPVAFVDLADAYERSSALKGLIPQLDAAMADVRAQFDSARAPLASALEELKSAELDEDTRLKRKRDLLLKLQSLEQRSAKRQQAIAKANEQSTALVDSEILKIREELKQELRLKAVFPTQDLLYRPTGSSPLDLSAELYRRLNDRLPQLQLELPDLAL